METVGARCSFPGDCVPLPVLHSVTMTTAEHISVTAVSLVSPFSLPLSFCHSPLSLSLLALFRSLSLSRSPSLIKMRLQQSGGGGEITPYLRERETQEERHVNYILQLDMWTFMAL